jgi:hypothetical protein
MIAFRIKLNGQKVATAGLPGYHVVSAIATSVLRRADVVGRSPSRRPKRPELRFELGGLWTSPEGAREHVSWTRFRTLRPGDKISLEIIETDSADEPIHRTRDEAVSIETAERAQLRHLKKKYAGTRPTESNKRHNKALQPAGASRRR